MYTYSLNQTTNKEKFVLFNSCNSFFPFCCEFEMDFCLGTLGYNLKQFICHKWTILFLLLQLNYKKNCNNHFFCLIAFYCKSQWKLQPIRGHNKKLKKKCRITTFLEDFDVRENGNFIFMFNFEKDQQHCN